MGENLTPLAERELKKKMDFSDGKPCQSRRYQIPNVVSGEMTLGEKYCLSNDSPDWMKSPILNGFGKQTPSNWDVEEPYSCQRGLRDPQGHCKASKSSRASRRKSGSEYLGGRRSRSLSCSGIRRTSLCTKSSKTSRSRAKSSKAE